MKYRSIAFIGAGNMAQAIIGGLVCNGYPAHLITVCAPSVMHRNTLVKRYNICSSSNNLHAARQSDVVVLAIKPHIMSQICESMHKKVDFSKKLVLSIAAGITLKRFYELLGENISIVRIMPNLPCLVNKGMSGLYAAPQVNKKDREFSANLMRLIGKLYWLKQESDINNMMAICSSAPAYFFLFMEAMQKKAKMLGFDESSSRFLVIQTALGAATLASDVSNLSFSKLRNNITSKGGTTEEAIQIFEEYKLYRIVDRAMQAVVSRAKEMEKLF